MPNRLLPLLKSMILGFFVFPFGGIWTNRSLEGYDTVDDGRNMANQLRLVVYPVIYRVLYIPGGCLGFIPSTVGCR